jgi:hypothetical protein
VLWRTDAANLSIQDMSYEEGGACRGIGMGDIVRRGDVIKQRLLG